MTDEPAKKKTNVAGRLYRILDRAKERTGAVDSDAIEEWAYVFNVPANDTPAIMRHGATVAEMARTIRRLLSSMDEHDPDEILTPFQGIDKVVANFLMISRVDMRDFMEPYSHYARTSLTQASEILGRYRPEPTLEPEEVDRLTRQFRSLREEVLDATDLDPATRIFVNSHIKKILEALLNIGYFGVGPVEASVNEMGGALARNPGMIGRIAESPIVRNFTKAIVALDIALNIAANLVTVALPSGDRPQADPNDVSPVIVQIVDLCGVPLELPPSPQPESVDDPWALAPE